MEDKQQLVEDLIEEFRRKESSALNYELNSLRGDVLAAIERVCEKGPSCVAALVVVLDLVSHELSRSLEFVAGEVATAGSPAGCDEG